MSTNINISVGDNKLLAQASLQQNASRQAQLEKEANKRLEAQATAERTKALAAQGLDANGNPLTGTSSQTPQVDRRPAANRSDLTVNILLIPDPLLITGDTFNARSKGVKNLIPANVLPFVNKLDDVRDAVPVYLSGGGPNGADACECGILPPVPPSTFTTTNTTADAWTGKASSLIVQESYITSTVLGTDPFDTGEQLYEVSAGEAAPKAEKISNYSAWTTEAWLRTGAPSADLFPSTSTYIAIVAPGFTFGITVGYSSSEGVGAPSLYYGYATLDIVGVDYLNPPAFGKATYPGAGTPGAAERYEDKIKSWRVEIRDSNYVAAGDRFETVPYDMTLAYAFDLGSWQHFAAVYKDEAFKFFLNGVLLFTAPVPYLKNLQAKSEALGANEYIKFTDLPIYLTWAGSSLGFDAEGPGAIHGYRFTPKAIYINSFTPPPTIITFA